MKIIEKTYKVIVQLIPVILMIGLIPLIKNDYLLTGAYILIIVICFAIQRKRNEFYIFVYGFLMMIIFEYIFVSTGVETFIRNSFFGYIPLWLPFLWAYSFVVIKRTCLIIIS